MRSTITRHLPKVQDEFLCSDTDCDVVDELARRQKTRHERQRATDEVDLDTTLKGGKWKELHMQVALSRPRPRGPTDGKSAERRFFFD